MCLQMYSNFLAKSHIRVASERSCSTLTHRGVYYSNLALRFFVLTTVLLVSPCLCAPAKSPWWTDSCNRTPNYTTCSATMMNLRHGRSPVEVRDQLKILLSYLKTNTIRLKKFHNHITHQGIRASGKIVNLNLKNITKQMRKHKKTKLVSFHVGLQKIARYLDRLVRTDTNSQGSRDIGQRLCYLYEIVYSLKALLCEVTEVLQREKHIRMPRSIKGWNSNPQPMDMTNLFIQDITILKKTEKFLKDAQKILGGKRYRPRRKSKRHKIM